MKSAWGLLIQQNGPLGALWTDTGIYDSQSDMAFQATWPARKAYAQGDMDASCDWRSTQKAQLR